MEPANPTPSEDGNRLPDWASPRPISDSVLQSPERVNHKARNRIIIFLAAIVVIGLAITTIMLLNRTTCLTSSDYSELADDKASEPFDPAVDFYNTSITFETGSTTYSRDVSKGAIQQIESIAKFYKAHTDKPMVIQLGGPASVGSSADTIALTAKRLEITKTALTTAGVPTSVISILHNDDSVSSSSTTDDDEQSDIDSSAITISLTSNQSCR